MLPSPPSTRIRSSPPPFMTMPSPEENGARMRCLTTSPAGTSTCTPASWRIAITVGRVEAVTSGSRWVSSSTRRTRVAGLDRDRDAAAQGGLAHRSPSLSRVHEHLSVALGSRQPGVGLPEHPPAVPLDDLDHAAHGVRAGRLVAHDPARPDPLAPHLELRLDHHHGTPRRRQTRHHRAPDRADRDERQITGDQIGGVRQVLRREVAGVGALHDVDTGILAQRPVQLSIPHIERDDALGAPLQQTVGEAAGRGAEVEGRGAGHVHRELVERRHQLGAAARDVVRGLAHGHRGVLGHVGAGLVDRRGRRPGRDRPSRRPVRASASRTGRAARASRRVGNG